MEVLYSEEITVVDPMSDIDVYMVMCNEGVYVTLGTRICFYHFESETMIELYKTTGYIKDICKIQNNIFFIDDSHHILLYNILYAYK